MKNLILSIILTLGCLLISSCAMQQRMIHPDGRWMHCKSHYYGVIGVIMASEIVTDCITRYQEQGFVEARQDENGRWVPKSKAEEIQYENGKELIRLRAAGK